jgi:hypothetical protein
MIDVVAEFGRRLNIPVAKTLALGDDFIVLLDYYAASKAHQYGNLFRISADGTVVWTIGVAANDPTPAPEAYPLSYDTVTNVEWRAGNLMAWTWGCAEITIDKSTGAVLASVFTK